MSPGSGGYERAGVAERRAQRVLNEKVGDRLLPRRRSPRLTWITRPYGSRKKARAEA